MNNSKNDIAWNSIFTDLDLLNKIAQNGVYRITSETINDYREARLMTKFDHRSQLPKTFADNKLSILPVSRGSYVIGTFETFANFTEEESEVFKIEFPGWLESLDYTSITSEATAINCLYVSGILHDFTGEENLLPTVNGRMSSSSFSFSVGSNSGPVEIEVENAQVEIDGGYEGDSALILIEAKNYLSDDFLVRQLFYPYKLWHRKISKKVRPIFLTYSNGIFLLREFTFDDAENYNSLRLLRQQRYAIQEGTINLEIIQEVLQKVTTVPEPAIPFPQADSFERVINLCEQLQLKGTITKEDITDNYDFTSRQTDYYANAAKYLGLVEISKENGQIICLLSPKGKQVFTLPIIQRQKEFIRLILSHAVFAQSLSIYFEKGKAPEKDEIIAVMKKAKLHEVNSETTYRRRASTIMGWLNWIISQAE